jgi:ribosomal protein S18 acetylase RimI-like enzyme
MAIAIKILSQDDTSILNNIASDVFDDPLDMARTKEFLADPRHHLAVAIEDNLVVGFVSAVHYVHPDKPRPELWINEVSVAETHRRQGLGKRLLLAIFEVARELGCVDAWVLTDRENTAAMNLYSAIGNTTPSDCVMFEFRLEAAKDAIAKTSR